MSEGLITVQDFYSLEPPERIGGLEIEHDIRHLDGNNDYEWCKALLNQDVFAASGLAGFINKTLPAQASLQSAWLTNGAYIYPDVGHLEYCTPESFGPLQMTAASHAGSLVIARFVQAGGNEFRVFRRGATVDMNTGEIVTKGYHVNLCIPNSICTPEKLRLLEALLVTQAYAWGGMVTKEGYCISPKSKDIGNHIAYYGEHPPTLAGTKPLGMARNADKDNDTNLESHGFGRFEDRSKTPSTKWSDFMGAATTSIILRIIEHPALREERAKLAGLQLKDSIATFHQVADDPTLSGIYELADGRRMSVADIQAAHHELAASAAEKVKLPPQEALGFGEWGEINDDMKTIEEGGADAKLIGDRVGWAGKYVYLRRRLGEEALRTGTDAALRYCLSWDRVAPQGAGQVFEEKRGREIVPDQDIERLAVEAPQQTRAKPRSEYIMDAATGGKDKISYIRWPYVGHLGKKRINLRPYQTERAA